MKILGETRHKSVDRLSIQSVPKLLLLMNWQPCACCCDRALSLAQILALMPGRTDCMSLLFRGGLLCNFSEASAITALTPSGTDQVFDISAAGGLYTCLGSGNHVWQQTMTSAIECGSQHSESNP